jgi:hypothetical protein
MKIPALKRLVVFNYGLPLLIVLVSVLLSATPLIQKHPELATAITYDLVLLSPILFFLISRRSTVSSFKTIPFFIGGLVVASLILPESNQTHLEYLKSYTFPLVELGIFSFLSFKIYKAVQIFRSNTAETFDFYEISNASVKELFGPTRFANFFASEISMFYYAFFCWRFKQLKVNQFSKYRESGTLALMGALLMLIFIETYAFHVLLVKWNVVAAWILTGTSIYTALGIIAHLKALIARPSRLTKNELILKNGLLANSTIPLENIIKIEACTKEIVSEDSKIGNLGINKESTNHNVAIYFKKPQRIEKMYGFTQECDILLTFMDEKQRFLSVVNEGLTSY